MLTYAISGFVTLRFYAAVNPRDSLQFIKLLLQKTSTLTVILQDSTRYAGLEEF
jgi:hypothetical protein